MKKITNLFLALGLLVALTQCTDDHGAGSKDSPLQPQRQETPTLDKGFSVRLDTVQKVALIYAQSAGGRVSENPLDRIPYDFGGDLGCRTCTYGQTVYEYTGPKAVLYTFNTCSNFYGDLLDVAASSCYSSTGTQIYLLRNYEGIAYANDPTYPYCADANRATLLKQYLPKAGQYAFLVFRDSGTTGTIRTQIYTSPSSSPNCQDFWP